MPILVLGCVFAFLLNATNCINVPQIADDPSLAMRTEMSSEAFPAPKAPPPSEVTRATREDGEPGTAVAPLEALQERLGGKGTTVLWNGRTVIVESNMAHEAAKKQASNNTVETVTRALSVTFFMVACSALFLVILSEYKDRVPSADAVFPPHMQPEEVPAAVAELVATHTWVVFLTE